MVPSNSGGSPIGLPMRVARSVVVRAKDNLIRDALARLAPLPS